MGCHPLREAPSLRRRGSISMIVVARLLLAAVRARALVATATCACLADHARHSISGPLSVAGDDLDGCTAVARLPRLYASGQNGAVVPVADAVQHVHLDLVGAVFDAKAGRSSKKLERFVSEVDRLNS